MTPRISLANIPQEGYQAVLGLEKYAASNVEPVLYHLLKLRASYLNGCAYCIDMHTRDALKMGESTQRLFAVAAWKEAPAFFTEAERAAFALTDAVTFIADGGVPDDVWERARAVWSEKEVADLLIAIATINVWNRLAISLHAEPELAG